MVATNSSIKDIDEIDKQILELLQVDAKITVKEIIKEIGKKFGLEKSEKKIPSSATAIRARIQRLEKDFIKRYTALIDCRQLGYREMVMASLRVNATNPLEDVKNEIEKMEKIKYAYVVTGEYPLFIMAKCLNHQDSMGLIEKLRNLPGVEEVKTEIVLDRIKEDHSIIIPEKKEEKNNPDIK